MKNRYFGFFGIFIVAFCISVAQVVYPERPLAIAKEVGGLISTDTTWTLTDSPIDVKLLLIIEEGVTLTIEPGVVVRLADDIRLQVDGELIARGSESHPITFTSLLDTDSWRQIEFTPTAKTAAYDLEGDYLSGSILEYCTVQNAGSSAILCESTAPFITNCTIKNNGEDGIIYKRLSGGKDVPSIKLIDNTITNNSSKGISITNGTDVSIRNNTITLNDGGLLITSVTNASITNNIITENDAQTGGGIRLISITTATIVNNSIIDNSANNKGFEGVGGGLHVVSINTLTIADNIITGNDAFNSNTFIGSVAVGGIWMDAIKTASIVNNNIEGNNANFGSGGIYIILPNDGDATISGNIITRNMAERSGAIYIDSAGNGITIIGNEIRGNEISLSDGGVISIKGDVVINENNIIDNTGFELENRDSSDKENKDATNNWWGTTDTVTIREDILDFFTSDGELGIIDIEPIATGPFLIEGLPTPTPIPTPVNDMPIQVIDTIEVGAHPLGIGVNSTTNRIYVGNSEDQTISVINGETNQVVDTIESILFGPEGIGINPITNRVYVPNGFDVIVIDGSTNQLIDIIDLISTVCIAGIDATKEIGINPKTNRIYVAITPCDDENGIINVIDGSTNQVIKTITVGRGAFSVGVNSTLNRIYVTNDVDDTISVIDGSINEVIATVTVGDRPMGIGVNSTTNRVYVVNWNDSSVSVIDGLTNKVIDTLGIGSFWAGIGVNHITNRIYVPASGFGTINVIDGFTNQVIEEVAVGDRPQGVDVNTDNGLVYVANSISNTVTVIRDNSEIISTPTPIVTPTSTPTPGEETLLEKYSPILFMHDGEEFFPISIENMLNHSNLINSRTGELIVDLGKLNPDVLMDNDNPIYSIDLQEDAEPSDCKAGLPVSGGNLPSFEIWFNDKNVVYGREGVDKGQKFLQYWFFYIYNDWQNKHEGDWEMIQILFPENDDSKPEKITYSYHEGGKTFDWDDENIQKFGNTHPVVYVAKGGHSSWSTVGKHKWNRIPCAWEFLIDETNGSGRIIVPKTFTETGTFVYELNDITEETESSEHWVHWQGKWGDSSGNHSCNGAAGPASPAIIKYGGAPNRWENPGQWAKSPNPMSYRICRSEPTTTIFVYEPDGKLIEKYDEDIQGPLSILTDEDLTFEIYPLEDGQIDFSISRYSPKDRKYTTIHFKDIYLSTKDKAILPLTSWNPDLQLSIERNNNGIINEWIKPYELDIRYEKDIKLK